MALQVGAHPRATPRAAFLSPNNPKYSITFTIQLTNHPKPTGKSGGRAGQSSRIRVSDGGDSYLDIWKRAVERERKANSARIGADDYGGGDSPEVLERKSRQFEKILDVPSEERDRIQRMQVIDRAAAAIAAARAILKESLPRPDDVSGVSGTEISSAENEGDIEAQQRGTWDESSIASQSGVVGNGAPGPNFWSWTPPESDINFDDESNLNLSNQTSPYPYKSNPVMEKEQSVDFLSIPLESKLFESNQYPPLPPFQSLMEVDKVEGLTSSEEMARVEEKVDLGILSSANAAEAVRALTKGDVALPQGVNPDGSRWWKETGIEQRPDGVVCRWTLTRGVSADKGLEWEEKYWEAADQFGYKELGSEKSGRDAVGNVWREFWKELMWQDHGLVHLEKTADKWGKNGKGDEWQEKWWEHYADSGQAEKWAHKWCSIDPSTPLEAGHAHVWHERWGEKYDGKGSSMKYTDKWAERSESDGWTKWGDKWDEHFDSNGHGTKQGETWWQGKYGERWNRTWGEGHNGSGWVHKYGKSSSGEHWDTHVEQDTWYERYPHYGFQHCFDNSVQLREVPKPSEWS